MPWQPSFARIEAVMAFKRRSGWFDSSDLQPVPGLMRPGPAHVGHVPRYSGHEAVFRRSPVHARPSAPGMRR